jgi:hypothetical protein
MLFRSMSCAPETLGGEPQFQTQTEALAFEVGHARIGQPSGERGAGSLESDGFAGDLLRQADAAEVPTQQVG